MFRYYFPTIVKHFALFSRKFTQLTKKLRNRRSHCSGQISTLGGLPTWEFFPLNPVFISVGVPYLYFCISYFSYLYFCISFFLYHQSPVWVPNHNKPLKGARKEKYHRWSDLTYTHPISLIPYIFGDNKWNWWGWVKWMKKLIVHDPLIASLLHFVAWLD